MFIREHIGGILLWLLKCIIYSFGSNKDMDACAGLMPTNLLEIGIPKYGQLPHGISVIYDSKSHAHAYKFSTDSSINFVSKKLFHSCEILPFEFSVFFVVRHSNIYSKKECVFGIGVNKQNILRVEINKRHIIFILQNRKLRFRNFALNDKKWHTIGLSVSSRDVVMTTDCINTRRKGLIRKWPSDIRLNSSSVFIGSCSSKFGVFQGQLKDLIFLPGADASVRTCPPRIPHHTHMDNSLPAHPDIFRQNSPGPRWEDCTWMDVGNIAYDLHANSLKVCVNGIWQHVTLNLQAPSPKLPKRLDYLEFYKDLKTPGPSIDVEVFRIEGEGLFCVLASSRGRRKKKDVSVIYKWTAGEFVPYQRIPTDAAQCWEHFTIGSNFFLAVANYGDNSADPTNSTIYKWNRRKKRFKEFQSIITWTARDFEYFEIDNDHFLAVANHARGRSQSVDSIIYKWNRKERRFREHQVIPTVGAYDWTYFTVNNFHFLAVAQAFDGLTTLLDSKIFVLQNKEFIFFQAIETTGATDWEFFSIKEDSFLVVANAYNYGPQNFMNKNQYQTNSTVYRLDKDRRVFKKFQTFKTYSAIDWEFFSIENDHYLVVSNAQNSNIEQDLQTAIYRWQGADKFVLVHEMFTLPNSDWEIFEEDGDVYFLYSNAKGRTSQIYKAVFTF